MDRRYQVFVSSTYTDLIEERREVIQALLELDCLPAGMELFPAANEDQWTLIKEVIDQTDYDVVIVGGRYGSTTPEGISYTEKEYDYAASIGVPIYGFTHKNPGVIPADKTEMDASARELLDAFRDKVRSRPVKSYESPAELGGAVSRAISIAKTRNPREGWVRGQYAMTAEQETAMAELRAQVAELKNELTTNRSSAAIPEDLESGDDIITLQALLHYYDRADNSQQVPWSRREVKVATIECGATWNHLIKHVGPTLMLEASEAHIRDSLSELVLDIAWEESDSIPGDLVEVSKSEIKPESMDEVIVQLFALGVIARGTKRRPISDHGKYWVLTQLGEDMLLKLRARRKPEPAD